MGFENFFIFYKKDRLSILILAVLILLLITVLYFLDFSKKDQFDLSSEEMIQLQNQLDSLSAVKKTQGYKIYPFNPNFLTDYKAHTLGMTEEEIDRLLEFRAQDQWINSAKEFQEVTHISDSLLNIIQAYFQFPEWIKNREISSKKNVKVDQHPKSFNQKKDLNTATAEELLHVFGIGEVLSGRIISYRERLGGFSQDSQLTEVYGLNAETLKNLLNEFTVKTPVEITVIKINAASASDLATIPGVSFDLAKKMWEYQRLRGGIDSLSELKKVEGMTESKYRQIQLYLSAEK